LLRSSSLLQGPDLSKFKNTASATLLTLQLLVSFLRLFSFFFSFYSASSWFWLNYSDLTRVSITTSSIITTLAAIPSKRSSFWCTQFIFAGQDFQLLPFIQTGLIILLSPLVTQTPLWFLHILLTFQSIFEASLEVVSFSFVLFNYDHEK
jgi:hypothetical protein